MGRLQGLRAGQTPCTSREVSCQVNLSVRDRLLGPWRGLGLTRPTQRPARKAGISLLPHSVRRLQALPNKNRTVIPVGDMYVLGCRSARRPASGLKRGGSCALIATCLVILPLCNPPPLGRPPRATPRTSRAIWVLSATSTGTRTPARTSRAAGPPRPEPPALRASPGAGRSAPCRPPALPGGCPGPG